ncbi:MAG TPA: hypothetical protein VNM15_04965 [Candidatus Binatia bacterium]|nr:hypothetical protein [Candidatus Binatia bacterium]
MQEAAQQALAYLQPNPFLSLAIAFVAGFAANKTVSSERRLGLIPFLIVGAIGLFLGEFVLFYFKLDDYLEALAALRLLIDFFAAFIGSFVVFSIIHFIKPT